MRFAKSNRAGISLINEERGTAIFTFLPNAAVNLDRSKGTTAAWLVINITSRRGRLLSEAEEDSRGEKKRNHHQEAKDCTESE